MSSTPASNPPSTPDAPASARPAAPEPARDEPAGHAAGMDKQYRPADHEERLRARWEASGAWSADPGVVLRGQRRPYAIFIPPPNVTDRLHLGHALNNTLQDVLARFHRLMGREVLWMPGTDHAGIATQTVVEKRLLREHGKRRVDYPRDEFVARVQAFKDEYEATITGQLRALGCSCDWKRQRFTMDPACSRAVREAFFRLFRDGLLYRGKRLVNWDPVTQTALADDEVEMEEVDGFFYYLRYPLVHPDRGEGVTWAELARRGYPECDGREPGAFAFVTVATTRPETYLGDTAVAVSPRDPRAASLRGLSVRLPLVGRVIPIVEDDYVVLPLRYAQTDEDRADAKAALATGFLKVTPAHDVNDYEIGRRHGLAMINVMAPDASISDKHGWTDVGDALQFVGMPRELARREVVNQFRRLGWLEDQKPYRHSVGHSYRSHAPIEPYLSDQWYVRVTDDRLAGAALRALRPESAAFRPGGSGGSAGDADLGFTPARYARTYRLWHEQIRDWCVSRQLWWGHRINVWTLIPNIASVKKGEQIEDSPFVEATMLENLAGLLERFLTAAGVAGDVHVHREAPALWRLCARSERAIAALQAFESLVGHRLLDPECEVALAGFPLACPIAREMAPRVQFFEQDADVLDTWFSSALWPLSTLGWPERTDLLAAFNPSDVLCTAREIITLWVSRMVMFNRYFRGQDDGPGPGAGVLPFRDVFIHAMVQDDQGRKMSKSLGNGVDPLDIIASHGADALRFTLCQMTTHTQDVRLPVAKDERTGRNTSPRFDLGRNLANKLWNAARFALSKLPPRPAAEDANAQPHATAPVRARRVVDRWMLSRLARGTQRCAEALAAYEFAEYAQAVYDLLWTDFCDWYLEAIKPTVAGDPVQQAVLAHVLEAILRLLHPAAPFVTEAIFEHARGVATAPVAGVTLGPPRVEGLLATAAWPQVDAGLIDADAQLRFERLQALAGAVREARALHNVPPRRKAVLHAPAHVTDALGDAAALLPALASLSAVTDQPPAAGERSVALTVDRVELRLSSLSDAIDAEAECARLLDALIDRAREVVRLRARLASPGYTERAPPKLVEQSRAQLAQREDELAAAAGAIRPLRDQAAESLQSRRHATDEALAALSTAAGDPGRPAKDLTPEQKKAREQLAARAEERDAMTLAAERLA